MNLTKPPKQRLSTTTTTTTASTHSDQHNLDQHNQKNPPSPPSGVEITSTLGTCRKAENSIDPSSHQPKNIPSSSQHVTSIIARTSFFLLGSLCRLILWPLKWIFMVVLPHTFGQILTLSMLIVTFYLLGISFKNLLEKLTFSSSMSVFTKPLRVLSIPAVYFYCSLLRAPFCGTKDQEIHIGPLARTVTGTAQQASDIFDSVVQLSDPSHLGLYQAEILELAFAVRWSSGLRDKVPLADGLNELSHLTRELKDHLVDLNGKGLNTFSFIAYQFSRLGDLIEWVQSGKKEYTADTIKQNLDILFEDLSRELNQLLNTIESLIPLASRSTNLGTQISERLYRQQSQLVDEKSNRSLWRKLLDLTSFDGSQLHRDLSLTAESIKNLKWTWVRLESIRTDLLIYRNNVANFKASFTGWHLADHGLTPEDEVISMREVIQRFELTLKSVKSNSRPAHSSPSNNRISPASASP